MLLWFACKSQSVELEILRGGYQVKKHSAWGMFNLGMFLIDDVHIPIDHWVEFLNDSEWPGTCSNWSSLEKHGDEIWLYSQTSENHFYPYPVPDDQFLKIKNSELLKLIYQWENILSRDPRPSKIKITEKRGVFNMEAID